MSPCLSISALLHKTNGHEFISGQYRGEHQKEGRKEGRRRKKKISGKKGSENCETLMYFISSHIIHFEMHLG